MQGQFLTLRDSFVSGFTSFMNFVPALIGAAVLLAIGWVIAGWVARWVERILVSLRLDQAAIRAGLDRFMIGPQGRFHVSHGVAFLAKWYIRLIFLQATASLLHMPQITAILNSILYFLPNLAVALLIIVAGAYLGRFCATLVFEAVTRSQIGRADLFSLMTRYAIIGFSVIAALNHIGVAVAVVDTLFIGLVASLSLAVGLAFGLGGQQVASEMTRNFYEKNKTSRLTSVPGGQEPPNQVDEKSA